MGVQVHPHDPGHLLVIGIKGDVGVVKDQVATPAQVHCAQAEHQAQQAGGSRDQDVDTCQKGMRSPKYYFIKVGTILVPFMNVVLNFSSFSKTRRARRTWPSLGTTSDASVSNVTFSYYA